MTLQLFDCLLQSHLSLVVQELMKCQSLMRSGSVQSDMLHSVRLKLEEDTVAYLSLVPDMMCSSITVSGETGLHDYLHNAHSQVKEELSSK